MSGMEVSEGRLLSQGFGVGGPPAAVEVPPLRRTVETVTLEIRTLQHQAQGIILSYAIEIGRRLEEAKAMVPHGEWGAWLKRELDYSPSTAQNFMKVFREYGDSQQSLFGGAAKSQTFGNLSYSKALRLLAIPDEEERERFAEEHDVEHMSVRELNEALRAREEAEEKAAAAEDDARALRKETERLQEELEDQARVYEAKLTRAKVETDQAIDSAQKAQEAMDRQITKTKELQDALCEANAAAQAAGEEHARTLQELKELRSRPVDVAVEVDQEAVEAARKTAIAEMAEKVDKANRAAEEAKAVRKDAEAALAAARKELEALKAKGPEVRELTAEEKDALTAEAMEQARADADKRVESLEKQLAMAEPDTAAFKVLFTGWQETYGKMEEILTRIARDDEERAAKLRSAIRAALKQMELQVLALSAPTVKRNMEDSVCR